MPLPLFNVLVGAHLRSMQAIVLSVHYALCSILSATLLYGLFVSMIVTVTEGYITINQDKFMRVM